MTLTETQATFRKVIVAITIAIVVYYLGRFILIQGINFYRNLFPPELPIPEASFGPLPRLKMKSITIEGSPQYNLDTIDGNFPLFVDRARVYKIDEPEPKLSAVDQMTQLASSLGFENTYTKLNESEFRWVDGNNDRTLTANVISKAFDLDTKVDKLSTALTNASTITDEDATTMTSAFIQSKGLINSTDAQNLRYTTVPSIINIGRLRESKISTNNSNIMKVNVYRDLIDSSNIENVQRYKVLGPDPKSSLMSFFVTNAKDSNFTYPLVNFDYWDVDYNNSSEYYISSVQNIWNEAIAQGGGIVSHIKLDDTDYYESYKPIEVSQIDIRDIYIAYYETEEYSEYLQPIYVFEGRFETVPESGQLPETGDIVLYYPAVRGDFVN